MWIRHKKKLDTAQQEIDEAREHLLEAQQSLRAAQADDDKVDQIARSLHELRRKNRFGAAIGAALRGQQ